MGKKSIREDKTIYQVYREEAELTRAAASEAIQFMSDSRIEKIESEKTNPQPDEILAMAKAYKRPELCNYFCSQVCPIGQEYVPEITEKSLSQITLEMVATLNTLETKKNRLIEITVDGVISKDEVSDFVEIRSQLERLSIATDSLRLWLDKTIAAGDIGSEVLK